MDNIRFFDFGTALEHLKMGKCVTRNGWNGKGMFLWLKDSTTIKSDWCKDPRLKSIVDKCGGEMEGLGTICMKTADDKILTGWLASQTDMLSNDWMLYDETRKVLAKTTVYVVEERVMNGTVTMYTYETVFADKGKAEDIVRELNLKGAASPSDFSVIRTVKEAEFII